MKYQNRKKLVKTVLYKDLTLLTQTRLSLFTQCIKYILLWLYLFSEFDELSIILLTTKECLNMQTGTRSEKNDDKIIKCCKYWYHYLKKHHKITNTTYAILYGLWHAWKIFCPFIGINYSFHIVAVPLYLNTLY